MNKLKIFEKLSSNFAKAGLTLRRESPTLFLIGGLVGIGGTLFLACRATLAADKVVKKTQKELVDMRLIMEADEHPEAVQKEIRITYAQTGLLLAKLYLPSAGLGLASIAAILVSNTVMNNRNAATAAAYAAVSASFKAYRSRLSDRFGKDVDNELLYGIHYEITESEQTGENGETTTVKNNCAIADIDETNSYVRYYDHETSDAWEPQDAYNWMFLKAQRQVAYNLLVTNGYVFLNDVCKMLGMKLSIAGQTVGWVYDKALPIGDNYIDFNPQKAYRKNENGDLVPTILLEFNVDGNILERAKKKDLISG